MHERLKHCDQRRRGGPCAGILVLFTDIEVSMVRWFSCGPFSSQGEEQSEVCKRKL